MDVCTTIPNNYTHTIDKYLENYFNDKFIQSISSKINFEPLLLDYLNDNVNQYIDLNNFYISKKYDKIYGRIDVLFDKKYHILTFAYITSNFECFKFLLKYNDIDINQMIYIIYISCYYNQFINIEIIKFLLETKICDLNINNGEYTLLHLICKNNIEWLLKYLLK